jgi:hypothetical protein
VVGRLAVDEDVVDEGALGCQQRGVLRLPHLQLAGVVAREPLERGERVAPGHLDLAHVADVEEPRAGAHREVLIGDARVLDGHQPAGKRDHAPTEGDVPVVERSCAGGVWLDVDH